RRDMMENTMEAAPAAGPTPAAPLPGMPAFSEQNGRPSLSPLASGTGPEAFNGRRQGGGRGTRRMVTGALWCIGGIVATAIGYASASSSAGGGRYYVFYGAIIFGAIDFLRGVGEASSGS